nr:ribonuclease H-like domain-containing protein [Tanacetum cinerariifolium]
MQDSVVRSYFCITFLDARPAALVARMVPLASNAANTFLIYCCMLLPTSPRGSAWSYDIPSRTTAGFRNSSANWNANLKLLRSLPPAWNTHTLIIGNKSDLDTLSMDDLYNNLKVYEVEIKGHSSSNSNSQIVAFVSSDNTSSANEAVNTAHNVSAANMEQIDTDDLEDMDLKWLVAMVTMRAPRSQGNRNKDNTIRVVPVETPTNSLVVTDGMGYDWSNQVEEGPTDFALLAFSSSGSSSSDTEVRDNSITELKNQLEESLKEKDNLKLKLENFETSFKNLSNLVNSQISSKDKTGLDYDSQLNERDLNNKSDVFESASDSSVNESEKDNNQTNDRYKAGEGYHAVSPPYTRNFMPPRPDLSFAGLDDFVFKSAISETVTSVHETDSSAYKTSKESIEKPKTVRPSAFIIEDWAYDSNDDYENTRKSVIEQHTYRQAENLRKSQNSRVDKRDWNGTMTQKLGDDFEFKKKTCFVCGSLYHLVKDCIFYENKMVGNSVLNNKGKATGQREVRPVWNNAKRVNHQNLSNNLTHPHPRRNLIPISVITNSGKVPVNAAKQSSLRVAASTSTTRYANTATTRPTINDEKPSLNVFHKSNSPVRRTFNQRTTPKNSVLKEKINTAKVNNVTTVGTKAVVSTVQGNRKNDVKSPNLDFMRPFGCPVTILNTLDHLGKFEGKADEGFLVGYSVNRQAGQEKASDHEYILLLFMTYNSPLSSSTQSSDDKDADESNINIVGPNDPSMPSLEETGIFDDVYDDREVGAEADTNNLELSTVVSPIPTTRVHKDYPK